MHKLVLSNENHRLSDDARHYRQLTLVQTLPMDLLLADDNRNHGNETNQMMLTKVGDDGHGSFASSANKL